MMKTNIASKLSIFSLFLSNAVPLAGALLLNWKLTPIILIYWAESGVVGFYSIIRMMMASGERKIFFIPFFIVHFGGFMFGHYVAIVIFSVVNNEFKMFDAGFFAPFFQDIGIISAVIATFASHGISFLQNFIGKKEYLSAAIAMEMIRPYKRIVVMHVTILASAFAIALSPFDEPIIAVIILIVLKTILDFRSHIKERKRTQSS